MSKLTDKNRLSIIRPYLCEEWNYKRNGDLKPENVSIGCGKKVWWTCKKCKYVWDIYIGARTHKNNGCPRCAGRIVSDKNRLSIVFPELCKEWNYKKNGELKPENVCCHSSKKVWWICKNNHEYQMSIEKRTNYQHQGCGYCSYKKLSDKNRFSIVFPEIAKEWNYEKNQSTPENFSYGSNKKVWWKCNKGHQWKATINDRTSKTYGCPFCNKVLLKDGTSFDSYSEAYFYLTTLKPKFKVIEINKRYEGFGKNRYDFFVPIINTYFEITGYRENSNVYGYKIWKPYYEKIIEKKNYVECVLNSKFEFIQLKLTSKQILYVRENAV